MHDQPKLMNKCQVAEAENAVGGNQKEEYGCYGNDFGVPDCAVMGIDA